MCSTSTWAELGVAGMDFNAKNTFSKSGPVWNEMLNKLKTWYIIKLKKKKNTIRAEDYMVACEGI